MSNEIKKKYNIWIWTELKTLVSEEVRLLFNLFAITKAISGAQTAKSEYTFKTQWLYTKLLFPYCGVVLITYLDSLLPVWTGPSAGTHHF